MSRQRQARAEALNTANEYINEMAPQLAEDFRSLLGVRIVDADGVSIPLIERLLEPMHCTSSVQVYPRLNPSALWLVVKIRLEVRGKRKVFVSQEVSTQVGVIQDGVLVDLVSIPSRRSDYTPKELKDLLPLNLDPIV